MTNSEGKFNYLAVLLILGILIIELISWVWEVGIFGLRFSHAEMIIICLVGVLTLATEIILFRIKKLEASQITHERRIPE